jgi:RNA polymerase sigma factor (sigma-70 family)
VLALDEALATLEAEDARAAEVVRLRYYTGLSVEETAGVLEVSERTVHREWTYARARLAELLGDA